MTSSIERGFVPLTKVEQEQPVENIRILLNLPSYVDQDRIGVNLAGIAKLCRLCGIRQLAVIGEKGEETSHITPEIVGYNSDGSAIASRKMAKVTVPIFQMHTGDYGRNSTLATRAIELKIGINVDELAMRVSETPRGVHSVAEWAKQLDAGFKTPIRQSGNQNLLHNLEEFDKASRSISIGFLAGDSAGILSDVLSGKVTPPEREMALVLGVILVVKLLEASLFRSHPAYRFSLFPIVQIDRAIALCILSRTGTLIKDLHQDNK